MNIVIIVYGIVGLLTWMGLLTTEKRIRREVDAEDAAICFFCGLVWPFLFVVLIFITFFKLVAVGVNKS